jgi:hypothetical protein
MTDSLERKMVFVVPTMTFRFCFRIMWIALIMVGALSGASAINMSLRLGRFDPDGARQAGYVGIAMSTAILLVLSTGIMFRSRWFGMIFTNDAIFLDMFEEASVPFTFTLFFMNLAVAIERIPYSMGRTKEIFWMGFVASWGGTYYRPLGLDGWNAYCTNSLHRPNRLLFFLNRSSSSGDSLHEILATGLGGFVHRNGHWLWIVSSFVWLHHDTKVSGSCAIFFSYTDCLYRKS